MDGLFLFEESCWNPFIACRTMLTESKWEKENNSTTLLKMLYILKFQTTIVPLPSNYNCCPPPLPKMTIALLLLLSPSITVLLLSLPPPPPKLQLFSFSSLPRYIFCSMHCTHDFTVWANHIHRLNSWYWKIEVITFASLHEVITFVLVFWAFFHLKFVNCLFWNLRSLEIYISAKCSG